MNPKIKHDKSAISVVTTCSSCTHWYAFGFTMEEARASGERHLIVVHEVPAKVASAARHKRESRARHAEDAA